MKEKSFKPQLCPNDEIDIYQLNYPLLISTKMDGCRLLIRNGQLLTRSLKPLVNIQLNQKFEPIRKLSEEIQITFDGEIFAPNIPFQFIVSCFMTQDYNDKTAIKKWNELCKEHNFFMTREEVFNQLKFYCFDMVDDELIKDCYFNARLEQSKLYMLRFPDIAFPVEHIIVDNPKDVEDFFNLSIEQGMEGAILRNPKSLYKYGRCTVKENNSYKLKPWATIDSKIIGIIQATAVNEDAEKTINELGMSRTSKKQDDRHLVEKANAFLVNYNGQEASIPIALTDEKKKYIWEHQEEYIGKYVEYKFMKIGMKENGLPRIPKMIRMREDK